MENLRKAHKLIFGNESKQLADWQMAEAVIKNFDVKKIGEELARGVIFEIVNHIQFPNAEKTREIVGKAENLATEFIAEFSPQNEPNMDEMDYLERKRRRQYK